jgi:hypothetical protein
VVLEPGPEPAGARELSLSAGAEDAAGNVEPRPHVLRVRTAQAALVD